MCISHCQINTKSTSPNAAASMHTRTMRTPFLHSTASSASFLSFCFFFREEQPVSAASWIASGLREQEHGGGGRRPVRGAVARRGGAPPVRAGLSAGAGAAPHSLPEPPARLHVRVQLLRLELLPALPARTKRCVSEAANFCWIFGQVQAHQGCVANFPTAHQG